MNQNQVTPDMERACSQVSRLVLIPHVHEPSHRTLEPTKPVLTMDRRVSFEVWQMICSYLYPSQLSRMSMVSTALHDVVASLPYWSILFHRTFGSKTVLWLLPMAPESKSYMLFLCASGSMVCEQCYKYYDLLSAVNAASPPLAVRVESYRQECNGVEIVGCPVDPDWTIQLCVHCRKVHYEIFKETIPHAAKSSYINQAVLWEKYYQRPYSYREHMHDNYGLPLRDRKYLESDAPKASRSDLGGDVGIRAMAGSLDGRHEKSNSRIMDYSHRAGSRWTTRDGDKSCARVHRDQ